MVLTESDCLANLIFNHINILNSNTMNPLLQVVGKDYVDATVVEAHIIPGKLLLTSLVPSGEVPSVAWVKGGVQVNVSLQASLAQEGTVLVR